MPEAYTVTASGRRICSTYCGSADTTRKSESAAPSGCLRPCSQFRSVPTLTPSMLAKDSCVLHAFSRIALTSTGSMRNTREGCISPLLILTACRTLSSSSLNASSFILKPLCVELLQLLIGIIGYCLCNPLCENRSFDEFHIYIIHHWHSLSTMPDDDGWSRYEAERVARCGDCGQDLKKIPHPRHSLSWVGR